MNIGILGTGHVALLLAAAWTKAGHDIVLGSRDPGSKRLDFPVKDLTAVVNGAEIVVNAIVGASAAETISTIDAGAFGGKTVIDVTNAVTPTFELVYPNSSLAEHLQAALPNAHIVKTMNTGSMTVMTNPTSISPSSVFLSGDDAGAKAQATGLLRDLGWTDDEIIDLGGIQSARGPEHFVVLFFGLAGTLKSPAFNIHVVR